jgi:hypothetical protein
MSEHIDVEAGDVLLTVGTASYKYIFQICQRSLI